MCSSDLTRLEEKLPVKRCRHLRISSLDIGYLAVMEREGKGLTVSHSKDRKSWTNPRLAFRGEPSIRNGALVPDYQSNGFYLMFLGGSLLQVARSRDGLSWKRDPQLVVPIHGEIGETLEIDLAEKLPSGIDRKSTRLNSSHT